MTPANRNNFGPRTAGSDYGGARCGIGILMAVLLPNVPGSQAWYGGVPNGLSSTVLFGTKPDKVLEGAGDGSRRRRVVASGDRLVSATICGLVASIGEERGYRATTVSDIASSTFYDRISQQERELLLEPSC